MNIGRLERRLLIMVIITTALLAGQWWLWPQVNRTVQRWHQSRSQDTQLQVLRERLGQVVAQQQADDPLYQKLTTIAPLDSQIPQLVDRLERLADDRGLTVQVRSITKGQAGPVTPLRIQLLVSGSPSGLLQYLEAVEHTPELATVNNWSLDVLAQSALPVGGVKGSALYNLDLTVLFYIQSAATYGQ